MSDPMVCMAITFAVFGAVASGLGIHMALGSRKNRLARRAAEGKGK